jgi:cephalosporin-C deacetylase-like acetyl esterase
MRARDYPGGEILLGAVLEENASYRRYVISYPSDGLTITGAANIPRGEGPFPVVMLLHGYFERDQYWTGADTWQAADFFCPQWLPGYRA